MDAVIRVKRCGDELAREGISRNKRFVNKTRPKMLGTMYINIRCKRNSMHFIQKE